MTTEQVSDPVDDATSVSASPHADERGVVQRRVEGGLDKALMIQQPAIEAYIRRVRRGRPDADPAAVVKAMSKYYLSTVSTTGGAAGAASLVPGAGLPAAALDLVAFTEASTLYALALAEVHGVPVHELERRRTLVMAVLLGNSGSKVVERIAGRTGAHWGRALTNAIPMPAIRQVNKVLGRNFVTKYGTRQGIVVIGKQAPLGFGAMIGAGGNAFFGYGVVKSARRAFGQPPAEWPTLALEPYASTDE